MKSLPDIPEELAKSEEYQKNGIVKSIKPINYTNFGEEIEEDLEEVVLEDEPSHQKQCKTPIIILD